MQVKYESFNNNNNLKIGIKRRTPLENCLLESPIECNSELFHGLESAQEVFGAKMKFSMQTGS